jgi:hypothetical protein
VSCGALGRGERAKLTGQLPEDSPVGTPVCATRSRLIGEHPRDASRLGSRGGRPFTLGLLDHGVEFDCLCGCLLLDRNGGDVVVEQWSKGANDLSVGDPWGTH